MLVRHKQGVKENGEAAGSMSAGAATSMVVYGKPVQDGVS